MRQRRSTRTVHERVEYIPTQVALTARLAAAGWTPSVGSWSSVEGSGTRIHVFSQEGAGPATYGHSMAHLSFVEDWQNPGTGWIAGAL